MYALAAGSGPAVFPEQMSDLEKEFEVITRHVIMGRHLNALGNLFGGVILSWIDVAAALYVTEKTGASGHVTASMENVVFRAPGVSGDHVAIFGRIVSTGRSSVKVDVKAVGTQPRTGECRQIIHCTINFVCMRDNKPYPYFASEDYARWRDANEG